ARNAASVGSLIWAIVKAWLTTAGLLILLGWASRTLGAFDWRAIVTWMVATPVALFGAHLLVRAFLPRMFEVEGLKRTAVIAGANSLGQRLAEQFRTNASLGIHFVGYFDDRSTERFDEAEPSTPLGLLSEIADYVKTHRVDLIYITLPMASQPRILTLLEELQDTTASIYFAPDIFLFDVIQARMETIEGIPVLAVCESPFHGIAGLIKRGSDIVLAAAILFAASPLMLTIAIGVKLTSPGP